MWHRLRPQRLTAPLPRLRSAVEWEEPEGKPVSVVLKMAEVGSNDHDGAGTPFSPPSHACFAPVGGHDETRIMPVA